MNCSSKFIKEKTDQCIVCPGANVRVPAIRQIAKMVNKEKEKITRLFITCLITGLSVISAMAAPIPGSNPPWFPSVMAFEHYDSGRTKLFSEANFNGSFQQPNLVDVRASPDNYLTPYNVVQLTADTMFLYGGGYGDKGGTGAFVAGVDPSTLSMVWSNQLVNTVEADEWDYPGVLSALKDGYLYVIYGYRLAKLDPRDGSVVAGPVELPTLAAPRDTSYNGFDALPDGTLIAKTVYRAAGCTNQGFSAFLQCPGADQVTNSLIVAIDPQTLQVIDQIEAEEFTGGRITCVQFGGKNLIYLPGSTNIYRYVFQNRHLSLDTSWGPVTYRDPASGQTPASSVAVLNDWIAFADNGTPVRSPTTPPFSPWMTVMAINQRDASRKFAVQPFKAIPPSPIFNIVSFSPSAVTVDPVHNRIYSLDAGPGVVGALELRDDGLHTVWIDYQRTAEFLTLIGPPQQRVLVGTDTPPGQFPGNNTANRVIWREADTGRALARSDLLPAVVTGTIVEPGYNGRMYYFTEQSKLLELTVRPANATDPALIKALAEDAFLWGYGPQFIYRFSQYNTIVGAPFNGLKYGSVPAAWNNEASNAGDASVLYINGFVDLGGKTNELVLTVPASRDQYYVVAYYDAFANTVGSIGTRTTPSDTITSYLLVGPKSPYAGEKTAKINGYEYPVMASDTDVNWFLIRVLANTLIDASDPTSVPSVLTNVVHRFALNTLEQFEQNGHQPVYPADFVLPPPGTNQVNQAAQYQNTPTNAFTFFSQLGTGVANNPIPKRGTGLSGTPLTELPPWVTPQYGATISDTYVVPSYGQQGIFDTFAPLGLTENGFSVPANWGNAQTQALQAGFLQGQEILQGFITDSAPGTNTDYWGIVNDLVGTYPNNQLGYIYRSLIVVEGGVANVPLDAIYPTTTGNPMPLDGNHSYKLTFMPPTSTDLPARGIYPPMVTNSSGNPKGFWSIHVYATDPTEAAAPFIAQTSVLNTSYSSADTAVLSVNAAADSITVSAPTWGTLVASTPILFGGDVAAYGLTPNTVYYVASKPATNAANTQYTFQISAQWLQDLSPGNVPIQNSGHPGPIVNLLSPGAPAPLTYGVVKPVTQLGSTQLAANQMAKNADGSLTMWFGPALPAGAPASNWIPTPSTAYYSNLYPGTDVSTTFQLTLRMYYPTPGSEPPSILPCTEACGGLLHESYIPPAVELVE